LPLSQVIYDLYRSYIGEGIPVAIRFEEFRREGRLQSISAATLEERLEGLSVEQLIVGLTPEQRIELQRLLNQKPTPPAQS
jgi:hypothetical protein